MNQKKLIKKILKFRKQRGWGKYHTLKSMAISLVLEAGELFQWTKSKYLKMGLT
ncbi:MAG: hypothetical protein U9O78_04785 [Patescibacteria group bacterium]|nr:hypothetical protein [Patescibacteria group bacterium]